MNWFDKFKQDQEQSKQQSKQRPIDAVCPECGGQALIWHVVKGGKNYNRPILFCQDKEYCKFSKWMDLPTCDMCGSEMYESVCRGGKNKGRHYRRCPQGCSFHWR